MHARHSPAARASARLGSAGAFRFAGAGRPPPPLPPLLLPPLPPPPFSRVFWRSEVR